MVEDGDKPGLQVGFEGVPGHLDGVHQDLQQVHAQAHQEHVRPAAVLEPQGRPVPGFRHQLLPVFPWQVLPRLGGGRRKVESAGGGSHAPVQLDVTSVPCTWL